MYELLPLAQHQQQQARREAELDRLSAHTEVPRPDADLYVRVQGWLYAQRQHFQHALGTI